MFKQKKFNLNRMSVEQKKEFFMVIIAFVIFTCLSVFSMKNFIWLTGIGMEQPVNEVISSDKTEKPNNPVKTDDVIIKEIESNYNTYIKLKNNSDEIVKKSIALGRNPISKTQVKKTPQTVEPEVLAPIMTIKAIVKLGNDSAATVNISSERPGMIIYKGSVFAQGKGKILSIDTKGVDWVWSGKKIRTEISSY